jgi:hypothetical protein
LPTPKITGTIFALAAQPKNLPMHHPLESLEIKVLENMYSSEIQILKFKLLSGAFWKDILKQKNKAIELAMAIHKKRQLTEDRFACINFSLEEIAG